MLGGKKPVMTRKERDEVVSGALEPSNIQAGHGAHVIGVRRVALLQRRADASTDSAWII